MLTRKTKVFTKEARFPDVIPVGCPNPVEAMIDQVPRVSIIIHQWKPRRYMLDQYDFPPNTKADFTFSNTLYRFYFIAVQVAKKWVRRAMKERERH